MNFAVQAALSVRRVVSLGLLLSCSAAFAAPAPDAEVDAQMVKALRTDLARSFVLDKELRVDAALRATANEISADHLGRIDQLLSAWVREEQGAQTANGRPYSSGDVYFAVWARVVNALALWQLTPGDADYERATLAVLKSSPQVCDGAGDGRFADFSSRILRIQAMPAQQRAAALATERQLLARWGQAPAAVAPWPDPLPQEAAVALLKRPLADRPALPVAPILASTLVAGQKPYASLHPDVQCALQQWWLKESLRQGATPATALNAFRYGTMITANARFAGMFDVAGPNNKPAPDPAIPPYPNIARRFIATGVTTVHVQLDATGKPLQASVAARKIKVDGIRGVRPVAFEDAFDTVSVSHALARPHYDKPAGAAPFELQLVWTLDEPAATPAKPPAGVGR